MAIQILEAMLIHEAVVLRVSMGVTAGCDCFLDEVVDLITTLAGQAEDRFGAFLRIGDRVWGKLLELRFGAKHGVDIRADDHAGSSFISELRIKGVAQSSEEDFAAVQVFNGEIDEDLG